MPRNYGELNAPNYATAPTIGPAGDLYYNTTINTLYVSTGAAWVTVRGGGLPAPYTGAGIGTFTDSAGVLWVAKSTVNSGNWARATDVLNSQVYRNAAMNLSTSTGSTLVWDTVTKDTMGMYSTSTGFWTIPVAGLYQLCAKIDAASTAAGQYVSVYAGNQTLTGGFTWIQSGYSTASGQSIWASLNILFSAALNDTVRTPCLGSAALALNLPAFGLNPNIATLAYVGTG
jgi:hypothetical protein